MNHLDEIITTYQQIIKETQGKLSSAKQKIYRIGTIRLLLFAVGIAGAIYLWHDGWLPVTVIIAVTFIPFLALVKYHNRLFRRKEYLEKKIKINEDELSVIDYDSSNFDGGGEYIDPSHLYSYDLDLFGDNSLFQYINRTSTTIGKETLAHWMTEHLDNKKDIEERQESVRELASELKFRQGFRILGLLYKGNPTDGNEIENWVHTKSFYRNKFIFRAAVYIIPLANLILLILGIVGMISFNWFGITFAFFVICNFSLQKGISMLQASYGKQLQILSTYANLIRLMEKYPAQSAYIRRLQQRLCENNKSASVEVKKLSQEMNALDQRNNMIISVILNGLFFWEIRKVMSIEAWKEEHASQLIPWLKAVGEMEALCSLATFAYNNPEYTYPEIQEKLFTLQATAMGHPLMKRTKCVKNDIDIQKRPFFIIITGANMAGKSTYLRTIGVNYLLACIGAPVCCAQMKVYPAHLITSLRTSDSLTENESYFFAELKRLKLIIDKLNAGEELFIILDEILKGTNSIDKQKGSLALIKQFMELRADGIIATHDLMLGSLSDNYPDNIRNYRFEADITNDELTFSYLLKEGVAQNMNACFLMKKMGIVVEN